MPNLLALPRLLDELSQEGLLREPDDQLARRALGERFGADFVDLTSNDYLGLAAAHVSRETMTSAPGAAASRLIHGTQAEHLALERLLAEWTGLPSALLFASGYSANLGALGCLLGPGDVVLSDSLNHASLIDGCRLSRAEVQIIPHRDTSAFARALKGSSGAAGRWVVVESYYSMDGDSPDLPALRALCDRYDAHLYVDEAHALGVFGEEGRGLCAASRVRPDVLIGGLGKACGAQGGFVASSETVRTWLWNRARSFVFSTATSPLIAGVALERVRRVRRSEDLRTRLAETAAELRAELVQAGLPVIATSHGPIIGVLVGDATQAVTVATMLREQGILAQAIRPPTVPPGASRLRLTVNAGHDAKQLRRVADAIRRTFEELSPCADVAGPPRHAGSP